MDNGEMEPKDVEEGQREWEVEDGEDGRRDVGTGERRERTEGRGKETEGVGTVGREGGTEGGGNCRTKRIDGGTWNWRTGEKTTEGRCGGTLELKNGQKDGEKGQREVGSGGWEEERSGNIDLGRTKALLNLKIKRN